MKNIINKLNEYIEEDKKEWLEWYKNIIADSYQKLKTDEDKLDYLEGVEGNDEIDNLFYSQGYITGLRTAKRLLENSL